MSAQTDIEPVATTFRAIGTDHTILATDPDALEPAVRLAQQHLADLDVAASRFRSDSEVSGLARAARSGPVTATVSPLLASYVQAALQTAQVTDGLVDFTVGAAVVAAGYDADIEIVRARTSGPADLPDSLAGRHSLVPGWRHVRLDGHRLSLPRGCVIDLGASAKAHAADVIAAALAAALPGRFLVNLGGDIATNGAAAQGGWRIGIEMPTARLSRPSRPGPAPPPSPPARPVTVIGCATASPATTSSTPALARSPALRGHR